MAKPRLFVERVSATKQRIAIAGDAHHYLSRVMRMKAGDELVVFDGEHDSFNAVIIDLDKRQTLVETKSIERAFLPPPNLELAFAPIKKVRTDFIVEKATELGVRSIQPIRTEFTNSERINMERLTRHAIEAVEQCGGNFVPELYDWENLAEYLAKTTRQLVFCDEIAEVNAGREEFAKAKAEAWAILIGPEGGFTDKERKMILDHGAIRLSLGPRILRADTAAIAAISLWQNQHGDWQ